MNISEWKLTWQQRFTSEKVLKLKQGLKATPSTGKCAECARAFLSELIIQSSGPVNEGQRREGDCFHKKHLGCSSETWQIWLCVVCVYAHALPIRFTDTPPTPVPVKRLGCMTLGKKNVLCSNQCCVTLTHTQFCYIYENLSLT